MDKQLLLTPDEEKNFLAGLAVPVFSLRSEDDLGVGQFSDLKLLADFLEKSGMRIIQLLPVQDTTIFMNYLDSSPYSVVSSFALHPLYLGFNEYMGNFSTSEWEELVAAKRDLNELEQVDYEKTMQTKWNFAALLFKKMKDKTFSSEEYKEFLEQHAVWLKPYAAFSTLREIYGTTNFEEWDSNHQLYKEEIFNELNKDHHLTELLELQLFVQFLLHKQLKDAADYCHSKGIFLKGDIPVGIMKHSVDAWAHPELYHMDMQTGAPPDSFSTTGQNWSFPTYNWEKMSEDGYAWWKKRLSTMAEYFDAYRLDHILGFFRIWEIPATSERGMLGHFSPALSYTVQEIESRGIPFRDWGSQRFLEPFIKDWVIDEIFGRDLRDAVIQQFLDYTGFGNYAFKAEFDTQKKITAKEGIDEDLRAGLYTLHENVLFVKDHIYPERFHPRIELMNTISFREIGKEFQDKLSALHEEYFYHRNFFHWEQEARKKLPQIIRATNMLSCGEDLGMVPDNVPFVMNDLGILRLILERVPAYNSWRTDLDLAPYLSVVTTSSHDTSSLRLFWEEEPDFARKYYHDVLGMNDEAPKELDPELAKAILWRNLESPAMLVIPPIQDYLAISGRLRIDNPRDERINDPGVPRHYWRYRMHLSLEELNEEEEFIEEIREMIWHARKN